MKQLNLPSYSFKTKTKNGVEFIFDGIRNKYVVLTPEEWVRQHMIRFFIEEKFFPKTLIGVEVQLKVNNILNRADIVLHDKQGNPLVIVECKAPSVTISQITFDQIARYNMKLKVEYLFITNGLKHFCCKVDFEKNSYSFLKEIPAFNEINGH